MPNQKKFTFFIKLSQTPVRLDQFLSSQLPQWSRSIWQRQIQAGFVTVDGSSVKPSHILSTNETVIAFPPVPEISKMIPDPKIALKILYSDDDLAVVNKPFGLVVHPGAGTNNSTLVHALLARFPQLFFLLSKERPGIVHRLDKNTSGLMVVALNEIACQALTKQFAAHSVLRGYLFLCWGTLPAQGTISMPIGRHPRHRIQMATVPWGRAAQTRYICIDTAGGISLGMARLGSGRTHQVRVHLSSIGHPLVGDALYGGKSLVNLKRQALNSSLLGFVHPTTAEPMRWELPLPDDMARAWRGLTGGEKPPQADWELFTN